MQAASSVSLLTQCYQFFSGSKLIFACTEIKVHATFVKYQRDGQFSKEVPNYIDNVCEVTFYKIAPAESTLLHWGTGQVPDGHELAGQSPNQIRPVAHIQQLLNGKLGAGDF